MKELFWNRFRMQNPRMPPPEEGQNVKSRKKKSGFQVAPVYQQRQEGVPQTLAPPMKAQKTPKRTMKNEIVPSFQQPERSTSDSLTDSSRSADEYRALRRKYMLLEDENLEVERELREVEDEVKVLEEEKFALLDQLVVLEGLMDPSEIQTHIPPM